ncbi:MAG: M28 family peptidase [Gemmatimonadota bacterium]|nr:MAG: M28 family peptidase [Gemmatimonadota bacterium]
MHTVAPRRRNQGRPFRPAPARLAALLAMCVLAVPSVAWAQSVNPDTLLAHVKYLASDELAGREAGEPGADSAAAYIARHFEAYGLEALGTQGYLQPFEFTSTVTIAADSRLMLETPRGKRELKLYEEWLPFNFSSGGSLSGPAFDAGYGLEPGDYEGLEGPGGGAPIAVIRGGTPEDYDPHASDINTSPRRRASLAREQGAAAAMIVVARIRAPEAGDPPVPAGLPAVQVLESPEILEWLAAEDLRVSLDAKVEPLKATGYNVAGRLPGSDPARSDELIVIGAHYDHLGLGGPGSLSPDSVTPHNGADDNASGTSVLLGLAKYYAEHPAARPGRSLVFVAFSAEEMGLLGSDYFVSHPPFDLAGVEAMINFDMVGRLRDGKLQIFGAESAEEFPALLDSLDAASPMTLSRVGDGYGPSDQTSFFARKIPVLHMFTGTHSEYHQPADDWQLINAEGLAEVTDFSIALIAELDGAAELHVVEQERPQARGGGGGYGPYLGTIPDFGEVEGGGLRLSGVRAGGPAEKAGIQAGDVVIEFGGKQVLNIYDYTYALQEHAPGDTVLIKVRRESEVLELTVVLGRRE